MTQQEFNYEVQKTAKGSFWKWVLRVALPFLWENRAFILALLKKNEKEEGAAQNMLGGCNKNAITDPHYGELGEYDAQCNWHPWT